MPNDIAYGKVTEEVAFKNGIEVNRVRRTEESIPVANRQALFDVILQQLSRLEGCNSIEFKVFADRKTHEPMRIVVVNQE
jgi:hypothetical protein